MYRIILRHGLQPSGHSPTSRDTDRRPRRFPAPDGLDLVIVEGLCTQVSVPAKRSTSSSQWRSAAASL